MVEIEIGDLRIKMEFIGNKVKHLRLEIGIRSKLYCILIYEQQVRVLLFPYFSVLEFLG